MLPPEAVLVPERAQVRTHQQDVLTTTSPPVIRAM